ncbi:MAG: UDP-N-acetylmuramate--L-alanine ligase [Sphingobacteriia bacterium]|nr:MAG: UDP-N-acetylmuramate--L-alanine ligase [Sphingobacteriia bacterium]
MITRDNISNIYFIGIGGIGMSALARYFKSKGAVVSGYDKTPTVLTQTLEAEGIGVHFDDNPNTCPREAQVVVYTPAIPKDHAELNFYREAGYTVVKRSDVLQWITQNSFNICVAGTHGKTTVTSMIAHLLRHTGYGCNAFLGGISANYQTNFWSSPNNVVVVEADEYDRSFLKLHPDIAVITSMDPDHLDIYGTAAAVEEAFIAFSGQIKPGGHLLAKAGMPRGTELQGTHVRHYHWNKQDAGVSITQWSVENGSYRFSMQGPEGAIQNMVLHMGGLHNLDNMLAAISVAQILGIDAEAIRAAVADYKGVRRRFEYALKTADHTIIDDYAHHPDELRALISGVRSLYPDQPFTLVFQPHLFSRTADQAKGFAEVLALADELILLPIYPARELPMPGITSEWLLDQINHPHKKVMSKEAFQQWATTQRPRLLVMAGAGDIDAQITLTAKILSTP